MRYYNTVLETTQELNNIITNRDNYVTNRGCNEFVFYRPNFKLQS